MELEAKNQTNEVKNTTKKADISSEEISPLIENGSETILAETVALDHDKEILEIMKATEEALGGEADISEPEENCENQPPDTNQDLDVEVDTVRESPRTHEESVVFETNSPGDDGPDRLRLDTPEQETTCPQEEEDKVEEEEPTPAAPDFSCEENTQLFQELCGQREKAAQRSSQLQVKLVEYLRRTGGDEAQAERKKEDPEQQQEYERCMKILMELKQQINTESEMAQLQEEELRVQCQEKLDKVEDEWRAFVALKQDVAVSVLSRHLGKQAAQTKVESTLAAEQLHQDKLIKLRMKHLNLRTRVHRLEAELHDGDQKKDPLQIQFEHLQAERLKRRKQIEKQNEESLKMQKKMNSSLEVLSNIKEKLSWSRLEVQAKKEKLAGVEATLARKRDLLTRIKKSHNSLQRDNQRLKGCRGLLGNMTLLRDFEDTVDTTNLLEEKLEKLKNRHAEVVSGGKRNYRQLH